MGGVALEYEWTHMTCIPLEKDEKIKKKPQSSIDRVRLVGIL